MELGVSELLINRLSRVPGVAVAPLSSVTPYAAGGDPRDVGRKLGVWGIVEGHLHIHDDRVRLTARLVDVEDGTTLWANSFTERLGELLAVQDSLASQIAGALDATLSDEAHARVTAHETSDVEAWNTGTRNRLARPSMLTAPITLVLVVWTGSN